MREAEWELDEERELETCCSKCGEFPSFTSSQLAAKGEVNDGKDLSPYCPECGCRMHYLAISLVRLDEILEGTDAGREVINKIRNLARDNAKMVTGYGVWGEDEE